MEEEGRTAITATASLEETIRSQQQEIETLKAANRSRVTNRVKDDLKASKAEIAELQAELDETRSSLSTEQGISKNLKEKNTALTSTLSAAQIKVNRLDAEVKQASRIQDWQLTDGASGVMATIAGEIMGLFRAASQNVEGSGDAVVEAIMEKFCDEENCTKDMLVKTPGWKRMQELAGCLETAGRCYPRAGGSSSLSGTVQDLKWKLKEKENAEAMLKKKNHALNVEIERLRDFVDRYGGDVVPPNIEKYGRKMEAEMV